MKQCPDCGYPCEDSESSCKNCGYVFTGEKPGGQDKGPSGAAGSCPRSPKDASKIPYPGAGHIKTGDEWPQTDGLAIASLVLGIISILLTFCGGFIAAIISLVLGITARGRIRESKGRSKGDGFAIAGIVMSIISLVLTAYVIILLAVGGTTILNMFTNGMPDF